VAFKALEEMGVGGFDTGKMSESLKIISEKRIDLEGSTKDKMSSILVNFRIT